MRLIDADALMRDVEHYHLSDGKFQHWIEIQPTIEERKTGKWMFSPDDAEGICTICQYKIYGKPYKGNYLIVPYNFCPNCGAKMK